MNAVNTDPNAVLARIQTWYFYKSPPVSQGIVFIPGNALFSYHMQPVTLLTRNDYITKSKLWQK